MEQENITRQWISIKKGSIIIVCTDTEHKEYMLQEDMVVHMEHDVSAELQVIHPRDKTAHGIQRTRAWEGAIARCVKYTRIDKTAQGATNMITKHSGQDDPFPQAAMRTKDTNPKNATEILRNTYKTKSDKILLLARVIYFDHETLFSEHGLKLWPRDGHLSFDACVRLATTLVMSKKDN